MCLKSKGKLKWEMLFRNLHRWLCDCVCVWEGGGTKYVKIALHIANCSLCHSCISINPLCQRVDPISLPQHCTTKCNPKASHRNKIIGWAGVLNEKKIVKHLVAAAHCQLSLIGRQAKWPQAKLLQICIQSGRTKSQKFLGLRPTPPSSLWPGPKIVPFNNQFTSQ